MDFSLALLAHSSLQGLIVSLLMIIKYKCRFERLNYLTAFILTISLLIINYFFEKNEWYIFFPNLIWVSSPFWYLPGPLLYLFISKVYLEKSNSKMIEGIHFFPFLFALVYMTSFYKLSPEIKIEFFESYYVEGNFKLDLFSLGNQLSILAYSLFAYFKLERSKMHIDKTLRKQNTHNILKLIIMSLLVFSMISNVFTLLLPEYLNHLIKWSDILILLLALPVQIFGISLFLDRQSLPKFELTRRESLGIDRSDIISELKNLLENEKLYLRHDLSIEDISKRVQFPSYLISKSINAHLGCSFKDLINDYRVNAAKNRLVDHEYDYLTFEAIAKECGFQNKSSFYRIFKREVGLTPNAFKKQR